MIKNIKSHRKISRQVFLNTEFLFITLGQTEGWIDKKNNFMWGTAPVSMDNFYGDRKDFELKDFSINEISEDLNFSLEIFDLIEYAIPMQFQLEEISIQVK